MSKTEKIVQGFSTTLSLDEVKTQLNSREQSENLQGMRNLVGLMSHGVEVDSALPDVIKLVIHPDLAMRRCVYQFLAHFSESNPTQALMAVNILQRALADKNALVRGMALRALSSIRVKEIAEIARLSLEQHVADSSPFVRRIAAIGVAKLHSFCPEFKDDLRELLIKVLSDPVPLVFGAALQALQQAFCDELQLLHPHFHRICELLPEMDSYEQVNALQVLHQYCRTFFQDARYLKDEEISADLQAAFKAAGMLLRTNSNAVVIEAASFLYHVSPGFERFYEIAQVARSIGHAVAVSLIRILSSQFTTTQTPILSVIQFISQKNPQYIAPHFKDFYIKFKETTQEKIQKIQILLQIASSLSDNDQDSLLGELKTYITYSLSQVYVEQQEITALVIRVISKIVESKAFHMLQQQGQLNEFIENYYSLLETPVLRVYNNKYTEVAFANDVVFQQSVIELCRCLKQINDIDDMTFNQVTDQVNDVLISQQQLFLDPNVDDKQDSRYPIPKKSWPSYLGFDQKLDPLQMQNDAYIGVLNKKSILQCTRIKIFVQEQVRHLMSIYQISNQLNQTFMCLKMRAVIISTVKQLRFVCSCFVPEFLRLSVIRVSDEPFEIKYQLLQLFQEILCDPEVFRAGLVYLKQRRILSDIRQLEQLSETDPLYETIKARYSEEFSIKTPQQVAEEQGNAEYSLRQMAEYISKTLENDQSYALRDLSFLQQFVGFDEQIFALNTDFAEYNVVLGSISQYISMKTEFFRPLEEFAAVDSNSSLREVEIKPHVQIQEFTSTGNMSINQAASQISQTSQTNQTNMAQPSQGLSLVGTGITVRGKVDVDDFLNNTPQKKKKEVEDDYYYSEEEVNQPVAAAPVQQAGKPKLQVSQKPGIVNTQKPSVQVAKPTVHVVKSSTVVAQTKTAESAKKPEVKQQAAKTATPAVVEKLVQKEDDLMSLFSTDKKPEQKQVQQSQQDKKPASDDLLSMLFK